MKINIKVKFIDKTESWYNTEVEKLEDIDLIWLFKRLNTADSIEQQNKIIAVKRDFFGNRSANAQRALYYTYGSNIVSINEVNYNKTTNKFSRGKKIGVIKI